MKDKKAAKLIIKRAKKHPDWYTKQELQYAKMVRKRIKAEEKKELDGTPEQCYNLYGINNPLTQQAWNQRTSLYIPELDVHTVIE